MPSQALALRVESGAFVGSRAHNPTAKGDGLLDHLDLPSACRRGLLACLHGITVRRARADACHIEEFLHDP